MPAMRRGCVTVTVTPEVTDRGAIDRRTAEGQAMSQSEATRYALQSDAAVVEDQALRVTALGPFLVERAGQPDLALGRFESGVPAGARDVRVPPRSRQAWREEG